MKPSGLLLSGGIRLQEAAKVSDVTGSRQFNPKLQPYALGVDSPRPSLGRFTRSLTRSTNTDEWSAALDLLVDGGREGDGEVLRLAKGAGQVVKPRCRRPRVDDAHHPVIAAP